MPCHHQDVRKFDGIRCCLSCGETVFEPAISAPLSTTLNAEYQYYKLNYTLGQEIRLIEVLPGDCSDPIVCRMHHVNLEDNPAYEAVSYTWATEDGDDSKNKIIFVEGNGSITITQNCDAALRRLRKSYATRRLWVDAICIHQDDTSERNHQVGLMDLIYSRAFRVNACIQDPWSGASVAFSRLFQCLRTGETVYTSPMVLDHLLNSRYFKRIWIIQEVALARSVCLMVNDQELLLSHVVMENLKAFCAKASVRMPPSLRWISECKPKDDIITCLASGIKCEATEPKDRIYALLSVMEPRARALIPVDYSMDIQLIYAHTIIAIITVNHTLDYLRYMNGSQDLPLGYTAGTKLRLPAQWSDKEESMWHSKIDTAVESDEMAASSCQGRNRTSIVRFVKPSTEQLEQGIILQCLVQAHFLDTITDICFCSKHGTKRSTDLERESHSAWRPALEVCVQSRSDIAKGCKFHEDENLFHPDPHSASAFCYTCMCTATESKTCLTSDVPCWVTYSDWVTSNPLDAPVGRYTWILEYFRLHKTTTVIDRSALREFIKDLQAALRETRNCLTQSTPTVKLFATRYSVGFAAVEFREGDQIFALDGASVPFILRQVGNNKYKLVGECYLWAALELDRWHPGSYKGKWEPDGCDRDPYPYSEEVGGQTRMIEVLVP